MSNKRQNVKNALAERAEIIVSAHLICKFHEALVAIVIQQAPY